jgi:hypothetical protein
VRRLHAEITLPGCGHWTQQERPADVNAALLDFLGHIDSSAMRCRDPPPQVTRLQSSIRPAIKVSYLGQLRALGDAAVD